MIVIEMQIAVVIATETARDDDRRAAPVRPTLDESAGNKDLHGSRERIRDFGCFVSLEGVRGRPEGLVHVSQLSSDRPRLNVGDVVKRGQEVKVKVLSVVGDRGLAHHARGRSGDGPRSCAALRLTHDGCDPTGPPAARGGVPHCAQRGARDRHGDLGRKLTSPERWELKQLQAAVVLQPTELADADEPVAAAGAAPEDLEEDVDIELVEEEPTFLRGQTRAVMDLSPIRVVANPRAPMLRAAMTQGMCTCACSASLTVFFCLLVYVLVCSLHFLCSPVVYTQASLPRSAVICVSSNATPSLPPCPRI